MQAISNDGIITRRAPSKISLRKVLTDDSSFTQNDLAFNKNRRMLSIASSDPAWLHTSFGLIALSHGFAIGIRGGLSPECLFNQGQALQIVRQRVRDSPRAIEDATIGAVASLANIEVSCRSSALLCSSRMRRTLLIVLCTVKDDDWISYNLHCSHEGPCVLTKSSRLEQLARYSERSFFSS